MLFETSDYKAYVREYIRKLPKQGRGEYTRIAAYLRVHTTLVSHIFRGDKDLTPEQACSLSAYLGHSLLEREYFLSLVEWCRAGSASLKDAKRRHIDGLRERARELANRLPQDHTLSDAERAVFYSSWQYSGVRLATSLPGINSLDTIAARLGLPDDVVSRVLTFLVAKQLVVEGESGYTLGPQRTHVPATSPLSAQHHRNWRLRALDRLDRLSSDELAFTAPMTLARKDRSVVRAELVATIERVHALAAPSPAEELCCLTIDWFDPIGR